jgi:2,3-dihydroxybenzoate-AMP ligase
MSVDAIGWPPEVAARYVQDGFWSGHPLTEAVWDWADRNPESTALVDGSTRIGYRELVTLADRLADGLDRLGHGRGDTVLVQLPNCWELIVVLLGCLRGGVAPVLSLPAHRASELRSFITLTEATAVVVPRRVRGFDHQALGLTLADELPSLRDVLVVGAPDELDARSVDLRAMLAEDPGDTDPASPHHGRRGGTHPGESGAGVSAGGDVALFLLSGGTTGLPKIIPRTHEDYGYMTRRCAELAGIDQHAVYLAALPAVHNFALACPGILGTLRVGGRVVLAPSPEPVSAFGLIAHEGVTITSLVPTVLDRWLKAAADLQPDLSSLQVLQVGGERIPVELAHRAQARFPATLQQTFGMAEGLVCFTRLDDPPEVVSQTQGRPISPGDEVRIVDGADRPVPAGQSGLLLTRGPYTLRGYYRAPAHNARTFTDEGWYRTGDLAHWHQSGNLVVDGRTKDIIIRGGEKISAQEVEELVGALPGVAAVAAVPGLATTVGEIVCVFVVVQTGQSPVTLEGVRSALNERGVVPLKLPDRLELIEALPTTTVGKVDKVSLQRELARRG